MQAIHLTAYGDPLQGLKHVEIAEPAAPGPNQVLIQAEYSPLNPSDFLLARGIYAAPSSLFFDQHPPAPEKTAVRDVEIEHRAALIETIYSPAPPAQVITL